MIKFPKPKTTTDITNQLKKDIMYYVEAKGGKAVRTNVVPVKGRRATNKGMPDIDCVWNGICFKVETKKDEKDKLRPSQIEFIDDWRRAGGVVFVVWDLNQFINEFRKLSAKTKIKSILKGEME